MYGDFFGVRDVSDVENKLKHTRYEYGALEEALANGNIQHYFGSITKEEFINLIY
ncbi:lipoate protein ligase C-terminal domain-containing protein [Priestia abyssalis]|uniref:lipoate protein ligase C-terminal domain-containing protein n=1 Tax=Priestia abyssalis TaxID=1221450 RepID=UPI001F450D56|nr:lipoate protein ligase C-terminal domain-containing protein [Priestia abyssalis]